MEPKERIEDLLADLPPRKIRSVLHSKPELIEDMIYFLRLKASGDERAHVTPKWFYEHKLREKYDGPSFETVRNYLQREYGFNSSTGTIDGCQEEG
tara:strand:- start:559 stop:846 length:288 start_codon:yes stop_codon:yes gene_type:complete